MQRLSHSNHQFLQVLAKEAEFPEMCIVRQKAAEWVGKLAAKDSDKAARAAAANLDTFFELTGQKELSQRAAAYVKQQEAIEYVKPRPRPQEDLCEELRETLVRRQAYDDNGRLIPEDRKPKMEAALRLAQLAEEGDAAAEQVCLCFVFMFVCVPTCLHARL